MVELELTLLSSNPNPSAQTMEVLKAFEKENRIRVNARNIHWSQARSELVNYTLFKDTPDVSDLGSTWLGGFIAMNELRPFSQTETKAMGEDQAFLPVVWNSGKTANGEMYAAPWTVDLRNIYFRKDHFEAAGINADTIFTSVENLKSAWKMLMEHGYRVPWAITTTANTLTSLHNMASWVWDNGGKFINNDGTHPLFNSDLAKEGMVKFFTEQVPFLSVDIRGCDDVALSESFRQGGISSILSGFWMLDSITRGDVASRVEKNLGVATLPMPSYVGGNNLVVWKQSRHPKEAVKLVQYLTSHQVQLKLEENFSQLPARTESLEESLQVTYPDYQPAIMQSLRGGRTFSAPYMWGMVESRLLPIVISLWQEIYKNPTVDIQSLIDRQMDALADRLVLSLSSTR